MILNSKYSFAKPFWLFPILFLFSITGAAQVQSDLIGEHIPETVTDTNVYRAVTKHARQIPGWNSYLTKSLKFPKQFSKDKVTVRITLEFIVEKNGRLNHPIARKTWGYINEKKASEEQLKPFIDEAFRVIINSPEWQPAINNETIVRSYFTVPLEFNNQ